MKLNNHKKSFFIFGLILLLGFFFPCSTSIVEVLANETQDIKLNVSSQTLVKGKSFSIYVYNLSKGQTATFVSSSPAIASVNEVGIVTGNLVGTTTILVTISDEEKTVATLPCEIKVGPPAISVQFSRLELSMTIGQKLTLERIIQPLNTVETAKFSSHNRTIATVSAGGRVTARAEGSTYIFAQIDNGKFAVCKVYVYPEGTLLQENTEDTTNPSSKTDIESPINNPTAPDNDLNSNADSDSTSNKSEEVDFETFMKNLNATDENAESNNSTTATNE